MFVATKLPFSRHFSENCCLVDKKRKHEEHTDMYQLTCTKTYKKKSYSMRRAPGTFRKISYIFMFTWNHLFSTDILHKVIRW